MILTEDVKNKISEILDSEEFMKNLYVDESGNQLDKKTRDELGQFYTPAKICIQMIEKFSCDTLAGKNILDPTCGSGNLLIACLIAGADLDKLFGNEYDDKVIPTCRKRILRAAELLGLDVSKFSSWQIHQGNALHRFALTYFGKDYEYYYFDNKSKHKCLDDIGPYTKSLVGTVGCDVRNINSRDAKIYTNKEFMIAHPEDFTSFCRCCWAQYYKDMGCTDEEIKQGLIARFGRE